jgi:hypothetical protein
LALNYSVFGLLLHSNRALPGIAPTQSPAPFPDIELHLGISPHAGRELPAHAEELTYVSASCTEQGEPALRIWRAVKDGLLRIDYPDGTQFWLDRRCKNLWATWPESSSLEETSTYLLGPIFGLLMRLRGVTCLHASAVAFKDHSVAFVGPEGSGKSTTAAAFARRGYGVLSDDIVALIEREGAFHVMPAYPHLNLWPDSVKMLYGSAEALPLSSPDWEKRRLALGEDRARFESRPLPLGAIYILGERRSDPAPFAEAVHNRDALVFLVANTYANKVLDRELRAKEFDVLSRLVSTVPVRQAYPRSIATGLEQFYKIIEDDLAALNFSLSA